MVLGLAGYVMTFIGSSSTTRRFPSLTWKRTRVEDALLSILSDTCQDAKVCCCRCKSFMVGAVFTRYYMACCCVLLHVTHSSRRVYDWSVSLMHCHQSKLHIPDHCSYSFPFLRFMVVFSTLSLHVSSDSGTGLLRPCCWFLCACDPSNV